MITKKEKGITLVALVITIVILIILATVTINMVFGENGLIQQAEQARDMTANSTVLENENMNSLMGEYINIMEQESEIENPDTRSEVEKARDEGTFFDTTTSLKDDSGDIVWIPGGFKIAEDSAVDADNGIVITNEETTKQFVWIPVEDYTTMYTEEAGVKLTGVETTTDVYSKLRPRKEYEDENYEHPYLPGKPNTTNLREPDVLSSNDTDSQYYEDILGYSSIEKMAEAIVEEYTATYNSIKTYKGFYIGRFELTGTVEEPTVQKGQTVLTADTAGNWYYLKKACGNVINNSYAKSTMIYGNQWDEVMNWLISTDSKTEEQVNEDSSEWGNYSDSTGSVNENSGEAQTSGKNEEWKANNIYDLAGNYWEFTQEADMNYRSIRGGRAGASGIFSASARLYQDPYRENSVISCRVALYIR